MKNYATHSKFQQWQIFSVLLIQLKFVFRIAELYNRYLTNACNCISFLGKILTEKCQFSTGSNTQQNQMKQMLPTFLTSAWEKGPSLPCFILNTESQLMDKIRYFRKLISPESAKIIRILTEICKHETYLSNLVKFTDNRI